MNIMSDGGIVTIKPDIYQDPQDISWHAPERFIFSAANILDIPVIQATRRPRNQRLGENKPVALLSCRERSLIWTQNLSH